MTVKIENCTSGRSGFNSVVSPVYKSCMKAKGTFVVQRMLARAVEVKMSEFLVTKPQRVYLVAIIMRVGFI